MDNPTVQRVVLDNGLTIILVPQKGNLATTVLVLVRAGSKYETKNINGLSHYLEHMCFKGTKTRPTAMDISAALDNIGAQYNAFTSQEFTGYYAKVENSEVMSAIDIVADLYLNPVFDPEECEREKGPVIEEIKMYEDMPQRKVMDVFPSLLYGDQPAGWEIAGTPEIVASLTREAVLKYRAEHYVAEATSIIISGGFDPEKVKDEIVAKFHNISTAKKSDKLKTKESQSEPGLLVLKKNSEQTHVVLGFRTYNTYDERQYTVGILSEILGGGMSSRLFHRIRERMGLAYYVKADANDSTDHGYILARAGIKNGKLNDAVTAIIEECRKLKDADVTKEELDRAKVQARSALVMGLETSDAMGQYYGIQEVLGKKLLMPDETLKKFNAVTAADIRAIANDIFRNDKLNLAVIGPVEDEAALKKALTL